MAEKQSKPFYNVGLHLVRITGQRFGYSEKKKTPVFEFFFDVTKEIKKTDNTMVDHQNVYNRSCKIYVSKNNFEVSVSQINSLLSACGIKEPLTEFSKLDPENPEHHNLTGKVVSMWCGHKDGWESWQPDSQRKNNKEKPKNDSSAAAQLDNLFGARLLNAASMAQQETQPDTEQYNEPDDVSNSVGDELPF